MIPTSNLFFGWLDAWELNSQLGLLCLKASATLKGATYN